MNPDAEAEIERLWLKHSHWEDGAYAWEQMADCDEARDALRAAMAWAYQDAINACNCVEWPPAAVRACIEAIEARASLTSRGEP